MTSATAPLAKARIKVKQGYDTDREYLLEGEEMGHTIAHETVIFYLCLVLTHYYRGQQVGVAKDVELSLPANPELEKDSQHIYKCPDISAIDGLVISETNPLARYEIGPTKPAPRIAFEIASSETWQTDLNQKPGVYAKMGIKEYFTFDPLGVWTRDWRKKGSLLGWRLDPATRQPIAIIPDGDGRLWSNELASWFAVQPDKTLRLFDREGKLRLTPEQYLAEQVTKREQELEAEKRLTQSQAEKLNRLAQRLREMGQNPDADE